MSSGQTSTTIAQQAINLIGDNQPPITGVAPSFDNSTAGIALQSIYAPTVQTIARQYGWDFARRQVALAPSGNAAPFPFGMPFEYVYPGNGLEVWELQPTIIVDPNNQLPQTWVVGNTLINNVQTKVIWTDLASALATYNNQPSEATWDAGFVEAVVRLLASKLAAAIAGKPETEAAMLQTAGTFAGATQSRNG